MTTPTNSQTQPQTDTPPPPRTHLGSLNDALQFTNADLHANRAGEISDAQRQRLEQAWRRLAIIGGIAVFAIIIGATFLFFYAQRNGSAVLSIIGAVLTLFNAMIIGRVAQQRIRLNQDLRGGVVPTQGIITHTVKVFSRAATYLLEINGERLLVPKPVFFAFEERTPYTLYRTAASKTMLSAEKQ